MSKQLRQLKKMHLKLLLESAEPNTHNNDKDNPALYDVVLDTDLTLKAHPIRTKDIGKNMKGKPDIKGKMFRDEFLAVARKDGSGWVDYYFLNPITQKEEHKTTFIKLVKGSDGKEYIVGSGKYYDE